jgi:DNA-binding transcriptional ArsR family regulator
MVFFSPATMRSEKHLYLKWVSMGTLTSPHNTKHVLSSLFASSARGAVLGVFMLDPTRAYYQRQIAGAANLPLRAVQRELERLTEAGLLYRRNEGNRIYYQVDTDFLFYPELRGIILKVASAVEAFRGHCAVDGAVRLTFLSKEGDHILVVCHPGGEFSVPAPPSITVDVMESRAFIDSISEGHPCVASFLESGTDLLGRRDDPIWRRIEAAGYAVNKGAGVP